MTGRSANELAVGRLSAAIGPPAGPLNGLYGIAAVMAVAASAGSFAGWKGTDAWVVSHVRGGWLGIDLFFVLSGYTITRSLLGERSGRAKVDYRNAYRRRAIRLFPGLFTMLAVHLGYSLAVQLPFRSEIRSVGAGATYTFNWVAVANPTSIRRQLGHLWAPAIEGQFSLVWPIVLIGLLWRFRARRWLVPSLMLGTVVAVQANRLTTFDGSGWVEAFIRTDTRVDVLVIGGLGAWLAHFGLISHRLVRTLAWPAAAAAVWCAIAARPERRGWHGFGMTLFAVCAAIVVLACVADNEWKVTQHLSRRRLQAVGDRAYGLYLWHFPAFLAIERAIPAAPPEIRLACGLGVAWGLTGLTRRYVEHPIWRRCGMDDLAPSAPINEQPASVADGGPRVGVQFDATLPSGDESGGPSAGTDVAVVHAASNEGRVVDTERSSRRKGKSDRDASLNRRVRGTVVPEKLTDDRAEPFGQVSFVTSMLVHARRQLGLSHEDVAAQSGLSAAEVAAVESDAQDVSFESLSRFGRVVGLKFELGVLHSHSPDPD